MYASTYVWALSLFSDEPENEKVVAPIFESLPEDITVTEGEDATFECYISARLLPSIHWYKDDDYIPSDDDEFKQTFDGKVARLFIAETYLDDAGIYRCTAANAIGEVSASAKLVINGQCLYAAFREYYFVMNIL